MNTMNTMMRITLVCAVTGIAYPIMARAAANTAVEVAPNGQVVKVVHIDATPAGDPPLTDKQILDSVTVLGQDRPATPQPPPAAPPAAPKSADVVSAQVTTPDPIAPGAVVAPAVTVPEVAVSAGNTAVVTAEPAQAAIPAQAPVVAPAAVATAVAVPEEAQAIIVPKQASATMVSLAAPNRTLPFDDILGDEVLRPENGIITVRPRHSSKDTATMIPNPFDVRIVTSAVLNEYKISATGSLFGPIPIMYLNGRSFAPGDKLLGFTLYRVRKDGCVLERDANYFFVPKGAAVTIRLPKA